MKTWQWLGYLGLIPFTVCVFFPTLITDRWGTSTENAFIFYSAIIFSFLSGTLWQTKSVSNNAWVQLASNVFCLLAYLCLFLPIKLSLIFLSFGYSGLLLTEYVLNKRKIKEVSNQYFSMRLTLTLIVVALHATLLINQYH
ncbi:DUF3429 domain-containing protein [Paraglaciecola sp.]|uniref:DUF3429 domain-containing protein n=1 Tax=Paraglaciecola sp. TaxID=1920173 RepID=UPI003EF5EFA7